MRNKGLITYQIMNEKGTQKTSISLKLMVFSFFKVLFVSCKNSDKIISLKSSEYLATQKMMNELIAKLNEDSNQHEGVGPKLTDLEIKEIEDQIGLTLPNSYKMFLKEFGNGAYWLYMTPIDDIKRFSYLKEYRKVLGDSIELVGEKEINVDSLLCLMTEDSNGGAWCWLTSENSKSGEWPLAYYSLSDQKLHYKVKNFTQWLQLLIKCKSEVIRKLDVENKLGLG